MIGIVAQLKRITNRDPTRASRHVLQAKGTFLGIVPVHLGVGVGYICTYVRRRGVGGCSCVKRKVCEVEGCAQMVNHSVPVKATCFLSLLPSSCSASLVPAVGYVTCGRARVLSMPRAMTPRPSTYLENKGKWGRGGGGREGGTAWPPGANGGFPPRTLGEHLPPRTCSSHSLDPHNH